MLCPPESVSSSRLDSPTDHSWVAGHCLMLFPPGCAGFGSDGGRRVRPLRWGLLQTALRRKLIAHLMPAIRYGRA